MLLLARDTEVEYSGEMRPAAVLVFWGGCMAASCGWSRVYFGRSARKREREKKKKIIDPPLPLFPALISYTQLGFLFLSLRWSLSLFKKRKNNKTGLYSTRISFFWVKQETWLITHGKWKVLFTECTLRQTFSIDCQKYIFDLIAQHIILLGRVPLTTYHTNVRAGR